MKGLVLISNMGKKEFVEWLGMAVKDRLNETCTVVEFTGGSFRSRKRGENFPAPQEKK